MSLDFPNHTRSYDAHKNRVCFWGHDKIMEVSFFVERAALHKLNPQIGTSEADLIAAFDASIDTIYDAAHKAYKNGTKGTYVYLLTAAEF